MFFRKLSSVKIHVPAKLQNSIDTTVDRKRSIVERKRDNVNVNDEFGAPNRRYLPKQTTPLDRWLTVEEMA